MLLAMTSITREDMLSLTKYKIGIRLLPTYKIK